MNRPKPRLRYTEDGWRCTLYGVNVVSTDAAQAYEALQRHLDNLQLRGEVARINAHRRHHVGAH